MPVASLPDEVLSFVMPSRFCLPDELGHEVPLTASVGPQEVARVVHFLAADASSYITGQVFAVNAGQDMRHRRSQNARRDRG
jgi:NAD(P)-dependent dehydrogenase (short-subunit alcohol dehydrogenase family)